MLIPPVIACEPIVPLTMSFMPWTAAAARIGFVALLIVVVIKCGVFAALQRGSMPASRAIAAMFLANVVSTIAGVFAAFTFIAPAASIGGIIATIAVSILPVRRLKLHYPQRSGTNITVAIVLLYVGSIAFFAFAQEMVLENNLTFYWLTKYAYIVCALLISMALTTFWEEYVVWRMSGSREHAFVTPVFRANAIALFLIMLVAALIVLPQRLRSPDFLIALLQRVA
jgi:hypothetical protein